VAKSVHQYTVDFFPVVPAPVALANGPFGVVRMRSLNSHFVTSSSQSGCKRRGVWRDPGELGRVIQAEDQNAQRWSCAHRAEDSLGFYIGKTETITLAELESNAPGASEVPVIDLSLAPGERRSWDRPRITVYLWAIFELLFVTNPWQVSSRIRVTVLRLFGAKIGHSVVFRPRTRVKFPWKLEIGDRSWIGEGVWIHNQDNVRVGHDVVISQESFITTGSHAHRTDMALITSPITIHAGVWITSRCIVLGGSDVGRSSLAKPMTVLRGVVPPNSVVEGNDAKIIGARF